MRSTSLISFTRAIYYTTEQNSAKESTTASVQREQGRRQASVHVYRVVRCSGTNACRLPAEGEPVCDVTRVIISLSRVWADGADGTRSAPPPH
ncbi:unnamed protein product [Danaus chrysippus]|uniref:(African queen) hypothetical protein n=1 Tax=Danaus chrysippus TaxID=151541 RepID=A0A8J2W119_9NEOP|nr:unnamed protein product [Danaus chrysippus]